MRLHCAVTHIDEVTLDECLGRIGKQTLAVDDITVVSGISPASAAFNQALDAARAADADLLVHLAADVLLHPKAVSRLVRRFDASRHYAVVARGFDIFNGENAPVGLWALNMRAIRSDLRFRDAYKMDLDFCERVEADCGLTRIKTKTGLQLGYHHPIWTAREMFHKFRYNAAKYAGKDIRKYRAFFEFALEVNPSNLALRAGQIGLNRGMSEPAFQGAPNRAAFEAEWQDVADLLGSTGREFFALHADFIKLGEQLLGLQPDLIAMEGPSFLAASPRPKPSGLATRATDRVRSALRTVRGEAEDRLRPAYDRLPPRGQNILRALTGRPPLPGTSPARVLTQSSNLIRLTPATQHPAQPTNTPPGRSRITGRAEWAERWEVASAGQRVLMIAPKDFAGSMFKWAEALNRHTSYAVRLVTFEEHQYGYPVDIVSPGTTAYGPEADRIAEMAEQAGVLHLKDEHGWYLGGAHSRNPDLLNRLFFSQDFANTPKAFTHYGGYARKLKDEENYIRRVSAFDLRIAMTPDLNFEWFAGDYIPHTIDDETYSFEWQDTHILAHSPSTREKKGTYLLEEALLLLGRDHADIWKKWSVDLIHGVSFAECMARKRRASLFFDQAGRHRGASLGIEDFVGWYGNSAIEAMAFGIPTIAHLAEHAFAGARRAGVDLSTAPVINIAPTRDGFLSAVLEFATAAPEARARLAADTRRFAVEFHGYGAVARRLAARYDDVRRANTEALGCQTSA